MDRIRGQEDLRRTVFQIAAFSAQFDDYIADAVPEKDIRHRLRLRLTGIIPRLILVGGDVIDQRKRLLQILQTENPEIRQFGIRDDQHSRGLRRTQNRQDDLRIVEWRPEQGTHDQRTRIPETGCVLLRMKIVPMRAVGDALPAAVFPDEHRGDGRRVFVGTDGQRQIHAAAFQRAGNQVSRCIPAKRAQDRGAHTEFCGSHRSVHRFPAHIQGTGIRTVPGSRDRFRIESFNDGVHQRHPGKDQIVSVFHILSLDAGSSRV